MLLQPNKLRAYMYMRSSNQMPEPVLDNDNNIDVDADNAQLLEWSQTPVAEPVTLEQATKFCNSLQGLLQTLSSLEIDSNESTSPQYMVPFYDAAKAAFDNDRTMIRVYFRMLYVLVLHTENGPRWGEFVDIYGRDQFIALVNQRITELNQLI
jgi:lysyl-tRNA synthetase class I